MTFDPASTVAPYLQTSVYFPNDFDEFRVTFLGQFRNIGNLINVRQIGIFDEVEFLTGEQWPDVTNSQKKRQTFRKIFFFSDASLTFNHNITGIVLCTHIYGTGTNGTNFFPIPYVSATAVANQIQIDVTPTQVIITKGGGAPAITNGVIVLEYLKN